MAANGAPEGLIVQADTQTAGRGRLNRQWESPTGLGLWFSIVLRPPLNGREIALSPFFASIAVAQTLKNYNMRPELKWPNDVLIHSRKVCGNLAEAKFQGENPVHVILGIGINLNQQAKDFPIGLRKKATSLAIETGNTINSDIFFRDLRKQLNTYYPLIKKRDFTQIIELWKNECPFLGTSISIQNGTEIVKGVFEDVNPDGSLRLRLVNNAIQNIIAGDFLC